MFRKKWEMRSFLTKNRFYKIARKRVRQVQTKSKLLKALCFKKTERRSWRRLSMNFKGSEQENQWTFNWHFLKFTRLGRDSRGFESSKHDDVISKGSREKQEKKIYESSGLRKVLLTKAACSENIRKIFF